jgi:hypothetical protein
MLCFSVQFFISFLIQKPGHFFFNLLLCMTGGFYNSGSSFLQDKIIRGDHYLFSLDRAKYANLPQSSVLLGEISTKPTSGIHYLSFVYKHLSDS